VTSTQYLSDALWVVPANYLGRETGVMIGNLAKEIHLGEGWAWRSG
jgi:hypothetical protein